ncbi:unnamed protein product, partial [Timema podura]|nr:unnamed protein product [Timema podura]
MKHIRRHLAEGKEGAILVPPKGLPHFKPEISRLASEIKSADSLKHACKTLNHVLAASKCHPNNKVHSCSDNEADADVEKSAGEDVTEKLKNVKKKMLRKRKKPGKILKGKF